MLSEPGSGTVLLAYDSEGNQGTTTKKQDCENNDDDCIWFSRLDGILASLHPEQACIRYYLYQDHLLHAEAITCRYTFAGYQKQRPEVTSMTSGLYLSNRSLHIRY